MDLYYIESLNRIFGNKYYTKNITTNNTKGE